MTDASLSQAQAAALIIDRSRYDHKNDVTFRYRSTPGLTEELIKKISASKNEPEWMLNKRLEGLKIFNELPMPTWGPNLDKLDLNEITYFLQPDANKNARDWNDVPKEITDTFEKLGIPQAEQAALAGVGAQYESETVYHNLKKEWEDKGVVFLDCDEALHSHPELMKKYFMTSCVSPRLHKFAALHAAVWSGGTFIYVPKGVKVDIPLQAYFRMNAEGLGQFEHTLIIVDEGAELHYIEGCSAPQYKANSLHAGCVEIHVMKGAKARYSSIENWSRNTYNLNTKRAVVQEDGIIEWINGNMGSAVTMLYPTSVLVGDRSHGEYIGIAYAGEGQHQDTGTKVHHIGKKTSSLIDVKSIAKDGGISSYRGLVHIAPTAKDAKSSANCDALMIDDKSQSDTYPFTKVENNTANVVHEATTGKISEEQLFYLQSRGISEEDAVRIIVSGFIDPIVKKLPLEYAAELNKLIELEVSGQLG